LDRLIECIPNFSEGADLEIIDALVRAARAAPDVKLLDYSFDPDHNRSVFTLLGPPGEVAEAAFSLCAEAAARIDMTRHSGAHPRVGAADVVPFVPVRGVTMEECAVLAERTAARIWDELAIPCFLYGSAVSGPPHRALSDIRRGQFEGMPEKLLREDWAPDYGGRKIHPTAGVTAVGARPPLIAFNVNLDTADVGVAREIARAVRESGGGFKYCRAIGSPLKSRGMAQVSMNLENYAQTPIYRVLDAVRDEAARRGAGIAGCELIGLAPAGALVDCAVHYLNLEGFDPGHRVLENYM